MGLPIWPFMPSSRKAVGVVQPAGATDMTYCLSALGKGMTEKTGQSYVAAFFSRPAFKCGNTFAFWKR